MAGTAPAIEPSVAWEPLMLPVMAGIATAL
jgi:hypothetical protein